MHNIITEIEQATPYAFMLSKKESLNLTDLKSLADEMLKPFDGLSDKAELPVELSFLKETQSAIEERRSAFADIVNELLKKDYLGCEEITIVDYGCGQGLASLSFLDEFLKQKGSLDKIKQVKLIDKDINALKRALLHFSVLFPFVDIIAYNQDFLSIGFSVECDSLMTINLFSHIIGSDINIVDRLKNIIFNGHNIFMHNIILDEISPEGFPDKLKSDYFDSAIDSILQEYGCKCILDKEFKTELRKNPEDRIGLHRFAVLSRIWIFQLWIHEPYDYSLSYLREVLKQRDMYTFAFWAIVNLNFNYDNEIAKGLLDFLLSICNQDFNENFNSEKITRDAVLDIAGKIAVNDKNVCLLTIIASIREKIGHLYGALKYYRKIAEIESTDDIVDKIYDLKWDIERIEREAREMKSLTLPPHCDDPGHIDDARDMWLDAFEGDPSNYWNID